MFIELVDSLRCVAAHEENWLVASFDRMVDRRIVDGSLGCPTCLARYVVRDGVAWLGARDGDALPDEPPPASATRDEETLRLAALLDLREPGMRALLGGTLGHHAHDLHAATGAEVLLVDPPASVGAGEGVSIVRTGGRLALAESSMRAAALDARTASLLDGVVACVRDGGRLVAPAAVAVPAAATELARDGRQWVCERAARASAPVQLRLMRSDARAR
jgi:hypothetical protein